jgi:hypothetical protein
LLLVSLTPYHSKTVSIIIISTLHASQSWQWSLQITVVLSCQPKGRCTPFAFANGRFALRSPTVLVPGSKDMLIITDASYFNASRFCYSLVDLTLGPPGLSLNTKVLGSHLSRLLDE